MANELNISLGQTGQTVIARIYSAGAQVGTDIALSEIANQGGYYTGNMPAVAAAAYDVQFFANGSLRGSGNIVWDGTKELTVANASGGSAPTVVQIRQEMDSNSTKLAHLDVDVSTRLATSGYTAPTAPPTVIQIRQEMDSNSTKLANLDAAVSTRARPSDVTLTVNPTTLDPTERSNIASAAAAVLFVDGATNKLKVNADHTVTISGGSGGGGIVTGFSDDGAAALQAALATRTINVQSPLVATKKGEPITFEIVQGDDYYSADGRALTFPDLAGSWPDWTGATASIEVGGLVVPATVGNRTGTPRTGVYFELSSEQTTALFSGDDLLYCVLFDLIVILQDESRTTVVSQGVLQIRQSV